MIVKVINDICVQIIDDGADGRLNGQFVYQPNSVRHNIKMQYALPDRALMRPKKPWHGGDIDQFFQS